MGSSPLARGKLPGGRPDHHDHRIPPACAGETQEHRHRPHERKIPPPRLRGGNGISRVEPASYGDHPRLRGENCPHPLVVPVDRGSPPLARGKPAAGSGWFHRRGDHPRLRGENLITITADSISEGSPPLARGKRNSSAPHSHQYGITPACAGKTSARVQCPRAGRDHPRLRGENEPPSP